MIPGSASGKTFLADWLARSAAPHKVILINTKDGRIIPGGKVIPGEVITGQGEIESGADK